MSIKIFHLIVFAVFNLLPHQFYCQTTDSGASAALPIEESPFTMCSEMPSYPGGSSAMNDFIARSIQYPEAARLNYSQGKVYIQFIVEKDGSTSSHKVVKGIPDDHGLNQEALRICKLLGGFTPGKDEGQLVRVSMTVPVEFSVEGKKKKK